MIPTTITLQDNLAYTRGREVSTLPKYCSWNYLTSSSDQNLYDFAYLVLGERCSTYNHKTFAIAY